MNCGKLYFNRIKVHYKQQVLFDHREQLIAAVLKKRAAFARAHQIVVALMEPHIDEKDFLDMLAQIGPENYADIVEERHINKLCGYPPCDVAVENVPTKKYQICGIKNKVYDITERKKFCSGHCFKASEYIKSQVPTSPLWLRDKEPNPNFKILPRENLIRTE
ncbi:putative RNA polymerase II subunit B1 CTD phosphatase RPAP2 homolog [Drosophila grimshawi]|uniref:putative RNA polymerase II subunit B1 CTD phosphatase RPAP2 homolog n=1 Tax=Drosophila grimshawi TaxID=7222 RepID=UPI000C86EFB6|nr:putative RNA polymerase II subunit B1 CTD phosphatase RPAP2 homolog [Drosophila grimshawi]